MTLLLIFPSLLLLFIVFGLPLVRYGWLSLHAVSVLTNLEPIPNSGANWLRLINDQRFWQDAYQTIRFSFFSVTIEIILAIFIALLLNEEFKRRNIVRTITLLPWALPTTVMALGWRWIFNTPYGPLEQITNGLGFKSINLLSDPQYTWITTIVGDVWKTTPFIALILLAGLQTIPKDLYEAFTLEGGKQLKAFFQITLPLLQPYLLIALLFRLAQSFGVFDLIQVMTGGGPAGSTESIALYAYLNAMRFLDFGYSATVMFGSFLLLILICLVLWVIYTQSKRLYINNKP